MPVNVSFSEDPDINRTEDTRSYRRAWVAITIAVVVLGLPVIVLISVWTDSHRLATQQAGLRAIHRALMKYAAHNGKLPDLVLGEGSNTYSWRLELGSLDNVYVPQVLQSAYRQYSFDDAWDSEANRELLPHVNVFSGPDVRSGVAQYLAVTGKGSAWDPEIDRAPETTPMLISLPTSDVSWTEPRDVVFRDSKLFLPNGVGRQPIPIVGVTIMFADGLAITVPKNSPSNDPARKSLLGRLRNKPTE